MASRSSPRPASRGVRIVPGSYDRRVVYRPVTKAVIPAAGLGTRFLPATKAIPKEMLPVVDRPAIQYVLEEAAGVGLSDVLMITGRNKTALENHFDRMAELERSLEQRGKTELLEEVVRATAIADVHYLRQGDPLGLGHAVLRAKRHVGHESFAVLLGDDILSGDVLGRMLEVHRETGASVVGLQRVSRSELSSYGVVSTDGEAAGADTVRVTGLVEKPEPDEAPSDLAIIGRYVLRSEVFEELERTAPGRGGEIQLTDALQQLAVKPDTTGGVIGVVFEGRRYDTGNKIDYLKANIELASQRDDLAGGLVPWLIEYADRLRRSS